MLMDAEVTELAGENHRHDADRSIYRHGTEAGSVALEGRRVPVERPRVRSTECGEVELESYRAFADSDLLVEHMVGAMLAGLSTRRYPAGVEPVDEHTAGEAKSTSKSAVSRQFVTATAERLAELHAQPLADRRWLVVFVDGFRFGEHELVGALGVTADSTKVPLGAVEGSTESATMKWDLHFGLPSALSPTTSGEPHGPPEATQPHGNPRHDCLRLSLREPLCRPARSKPSSNWRNHKAA